MSGTATSRVKETSTIVCFLVMWGVDMTFNFLEIVLEVILRTVKKNLQNTQTSENFSIQGDKNRALSDMIWSELLQEVEEGSFSSSI